MTTIFLFTDLMSLDDDVGEEERGDPNVRKFELKVPPTPFRIRFDFSHLLPDPVLIDRLLTNQGHPSQLGPTFLTPPIQWISSISYNLCHHIWYEDLDETSPFSRLDQLLDYRFETLLVDDIETCDPDLLQPYPLSAGRSWQADRTSIFLNDTNYFQSEAFIRRAQTGTLYLTVTVSLSIPCRVDLHLVDLPQPVQAPIFQRVIKPLKNTTFYSYYHQIFIRNYDPEDQHKIVLLWPCSLEPCSLEPCSLDPCPSCCCLLEPNSSDTQIVSVRRRFNWLIYTFSSPHALFGLKMNENLDIDVLICYHSILLTFSRNN